MARRENRYTAFHSERSGKRYPLRTAWKEAKIRSRPKSVPACSVIIPLYHGPLEAVRAVDSVLAQTRGDFELIIVDDGAPDESRAAVLACADPRMRLLSQPHAGAAVARNHGLASARAPWAAFLDADDEWRPNFLERMLAFVGASRPMAAAFCNILSIRDGQPWLSLPLSEPRVLDDYFAIALRNDGRGMTSSSTLVEVATARRIGGFPAVQRSEDIDTWLRLALAGPIGCVPEVLSWYHNEGYGAGRPLPEPCFPEAVRTMRRLREARLVPATLHRPLARLESLYLLAYARALIDYGERARAREVLWSECSWRHCPPAHLAKAVARSIGI